MNTELLLALGLGLGGAVLLAVLLLRRRRAPPPPSARAPAPAVEAAQPPAALLDAQRQATTEALRLARQRKAEEAARLEAARAEAEHLAAQRQADERLAAQRLADERQAAQRLASEREAAARQSRLDAQRRAADAAQARATPVVPTARVAQVVADVLPARPVPAMPPVASIPRAPLVLVADDSKVVRVKTGRLLEKQGWQVLLADDGAAALAMLDSHRPDLLVTDVEMPGLDGFALTRRVRAHARGARLPVVMITSSDDRHRADAAAAGVDLLLGKPYEEDALLAHLRRLLKLPQPEAALP